MDVDTLVIDSLIVEEAKSDAVNAFLGSKFLISDIEMIIDTFIRKLEDHAQEAF